MFFMFKSMLNSNHMSTSGYQNEKRNEMITPSLSSAAYSVFHNLITTSGESTVFTIDDNDEIELTLPLADYYDKSDVDDKLTTLTTEVTTDISTLQTSVGNNSTAISTLQTDVDECDVNISTNTAAIASLPSYYSQILHGSKGFVTFSSYTDTWGYDQSVVYYPDEVSDYGSITAYVSDTTAVIEICAFSRPIELSSTQMTTWWDTVISGYGGVVIGSPYSAIPTLPFTPTTLTVSQFDVSFKNVVSVITSNTTYAQYNLMTDFTRYQTVITTASTTGQKIYARVYVNPDDPNYFIPSNTISYFSVNVKYQLY